MTPDDLDTKSLEELDRIFAVEVASWNFHKGNPLEEWVTLHEDWWMSVAECDRRGPASMFKRIHPFSSSADAVLPWLEKHEQWRSDYFKVKARTCVVVDGWDASAPTFPHAAVLALIRAERAKKANA